MKEFEVHRKAQKLLSRITSVTSESETDFGVADLVTPNVVWEVKRKLRTTTQISEAASQADRYNRHLKKTRIGIVYPDVKNHLGNAYRVAQVYPGLILLDPYTEVFYQADETGYGWGEVTIDGVTCWSNRSRMERNLVKIESDLELVKDWQSADPLSLLNVFHSLSWSEMELIYGEVGYRAPSEEVCPLMEASLSKKKSDLTAAISEHRSKYPEQTPLNTLV